MNLLYPTTLSEEETLKQALQGRSIARFGDAELKHALGTGHKFGKTQKYEPGLTIEMRRLLTGRTVSLVCIPNADPALPNYERFWRDYSATQYSQMMTDKVFGSSFISRPDSAPHIDTREFWTWMRQLWLGREIVLVIGHDTDGKHHSLTPADLSDASRVTTVYGPQRDAYTEIDRIEADIGTPTGSVILCLGATATVLAERLARKGIHALDLGHVGRFMPRDLKV